MKNNSMAVRTRTKNTRTARFMRKHRGSTKVIAVSLAFIMAFSAFGANISSIVHLLEAFAGSGDYKVVSGHNVYYTADLTLYDYKTDSEIKGGSDNNDYDGWNRNSIFNRALYETGYSQIARSGNQWPLYLGLQYPYQQLGNQMINAKGNPYNYSIVVNSEAGTNDNDAGSSGAAIGQVDSRLYGKDITQAGGKVILPYFDEEFLTAKLSSVLSSETISSQSLSDYSSTSLGSVLHNQKFKFIKYNDGYYKYLSAEDELGYAGNTFTVGSGGYVSDLSWTNQNGTHHNSKPAFFPYKTMGSSKGRFGYGAKFEIPFTMSADGKTVTRDSTTGAVTATGVNDIKFKFSGDDDVWVFIDDYLVLDVGGAHGKVSGEINFNKANPSAHTEKVKGTGYDMQDGKSSVNSSGYSTPGISTLFNNTLKLYDDPTKQHILTVYYIERGSLESNCEISFNFQIADIVTVKNKLNTDDVNDFFLADTKALADTEAVEYVMSSNSATAGTTPDKTEKPITDNGKGYVTLSFNTGGHGSINSKTVVQGSQVVLPKGYNLDYPGYRIKGWSQSNGGSVNSRSPYTVNSTHTLYAVWQKIPLSPLAMPPLPALIHMKTTYSDITSINGDSSSQYLKDQLVYIDSKNVIANMTSKGLSANEWGHWFRDSNACQHPTNGGTYNLSIDSSISSFVRRDSDQVKFRKDGLYYLWEATSSTASSVSTKNINSYISGSNKKVLNATGNDWVDNYYGLYNALCDYWDQYKHTTNSAIIDKYNKAVEIYTKLGQNADYSTVLNDLNSAIDDYNNNYVTKYAYSDHANYNNQTVDFYINSTNQPTVVSDNSYGDAKYLYGGTDSRSYTPETVEAPENHIETTNASPTNYWKVTVPRFVMVQECEKTSGNPTATEAGEAPNKIKITVGTDTLEKTAEELESVSDDGYPCWYVTDDLQKGITDPVPTYTMSNTAWIWVYSESGKPTVECVNPYTGRRTSGNVLSHSSDDPDNYYRVEIYKTVTKIIGSVAQGSQDTKIVVNNGTETSSSAITGAAPCYFETSSQSGWYNLVTIVVEKPDWWAGCYLHIGDGPLKTEWSSSVAMVNATGYFYFYYVPSSSSGRTYVFKSLAGDNYSQGYSEPNGYQSEDVTVSSNDTLFSGPSHPNNNSKYTFSTSGALISSSSNNTYYPYTATYKLAQLSGTLTSPVETRSIQPSDPQNSDDPDAKTDPDTMDDPDAKTDPDTTDVPDAKTDPDTTDVPDAKTDPDTTGVPDAKTDPDTTGVPDAKTDHDTTGDSTPVSCSKGVNGQFTGTGGSFNKVGETGFKLYDPLFKDITGGAQEYAVRMTTEDGKYNLMFNQSAKFSYQFLRGSKLKVAQTGTSYAFDNAKRRTGTTEKGGTVKFNETVDPTTDNVPLYNRYSTTYKITDMVGNTSTNGTNNAKYIATNENGSNDSDNASLTLVNLDNTGSADEGTQINIEYTNKVRVGTLQIKKEFSPGTLNTLKNAYKNNSSNDPTFYFQVSFSNVFGGSDDTSKVYTGAFNVSTTANSTGSAGTYQKVNEGTPQEVAYCIPFKFSEVYDVYADESGEYRGYTVTIEGIPVYTKYTLTEVFPSTDTSGLSLGKVTEAKKSGESTSLAIENNVTESSRITTTRDEPSKENYTNDADVNSAAYYDTDSDASFYILTAQNSADAYIFLGKKIDHHYYYTVEGEGDNPAGLYNSTVTVGAAPSDASKDLNGYQAATGAEQSFIYKIEKFANGADMSDDDNIQATFYEVISFDSSKSVGIYYYKKIKADPNCDYRITELTDWSWKYALSGDASVEDDSGTGSGAVAIITSFPGVTLESGSQLILNSTAAAPTEVQANSARADYTNNKVTDNKKDVEGDTSIKRNVINIAS